FRTELLQNVVVISENFHRDVRPNTLKHFVESHLNRLRDHDARSRIQCFNLCRDDFRQVVFADWMIVDLAPLALRFVVDVKVAITRRDWVGCNFCAADPRKDVRDFRHAVFDFLLGLSLLFDASLKINTTRPEHHHGESPLVELGNEVCAQPCEDKKCNGENSYGAEYDEPSQSQRKTQYR